MSLENAKTVRRAYEHLNRRDVERLVRLCDDDFVIDMSERVFNPDMYRGSDGIRRFFAGVEDLWDTYRWDVTETLVAGDVVVAMIHCEGRGREGVRVDWDVAWLWTFREQTPISLRLYRDPAEALEAAGLGEP
jgi:ketosteroid isomerase-like protein